MKTHNNADLLTLANLDQHNRSITVTSRLPLNNTSC